MSQSYIILLFICLKYPYLALASNPYLDMGYEDVPEPHPPNK